MIILGIETSCDETSVSLVKQSDNSFTILSQTTATSLSLHAKTGGIIPEVAAREQLAYMLPVLKEVFQQGLNYDIEKEKTPPPIDRIAVTYGPGLIGSLLVGIETARVLSYIWNKPLIPVNHLYGHIYANWLSINKEQPKRITFPVLALVISGGHTDLILMKSHTDITVIGGTRDDAAGEAFDKGGRLMHLPYPAGPIIEEKAKGGNPKAIPFPRPLMHEKTYDFSFSGLKTAVLRYIKQSPTLTDEKVNDICASMQQAIIDVLIHKTLQAAEKYDVKTILLSGGVAANQTLVDQFKLQSSKFEIDLWVPPKALCTDNGAMIAVASYFRNLTVAMEDITVNPELYF